MTLTCKVSSIEVTFHWRCYTCMYCRNTTISITRFSCKIWIWRVWVWVRVYA